MIINFRLVKHSININLFQPVERYSLNRILKIQTLEKYINIHNNTIKRINESKRLKEKGWGGREDKGERDYTVSRITKILFGLKSEVSALKAEESCAHKEQGSVAR